MQILGIVGSPRRDRGLSHRIVTRVLDGAAAAGTETDLLTLIDEQPEYCIHCGHNCFAEGNCIQEPEATARSERLGAADALVIAAPVYCWQPAGLTVALFDKVRFPTRPWTGGPNTAVPGLAFAVAGGTGTGVFPALQSMYAWLCLWKFRPLDPVPVTRFNLDRVVEEAGSYGRALAERPLQPFADLAEQMVAYDALPYMDYGRVDEFRWLAEQVLAGLDARGEAGAPVEEVRRMLEEGKGLGAQGDVEGEARLVIQSYRTGYELW